MKMKISVFILLVCCLSLSNALAESPNSYDAYKFSKRYECSKGAVNFAHEKHADVYAKDCHFCHSGLEAFGGEVSQLFAHNFCNNCHMQKRSVSADDCSSCHETPAIASVK